MNAQLPRNNNGNHVAAVAAVAAVPQGGTTVLGGGDGVRRSGCISMDWNVSAIVLVSFVILAGLIWHTTAVIPGIGGMTGEKGGVFLGFVVLAAIIVVSMVSLRDGSAGNEQSPEFELASVILWTIITAIFIIAMGFAWAEWGANKGTVNVAWPITHTIITATAIALNIGLPVAYDKMCSGVGVE